MVVFDNKDYDLWCNFPKFSTYFFWISGIIFITKKTLELIQVQVEQGTNNQISFFFWYKMRNNYTDFEEVSKRVFWQGIKMAGSFTDVKVKDVYITGNGLRIYFNIKVIYQINVNAGYKLTENKSLLSLTILPLINVFKKTERTDRSLIRNRNNRQYYP